jgi:hypothetical protein
MATPFTCVLQIIVNAPERLSLHDAPSFVSNTNGRDFTFPVKLLGSALNASSSNVFGTIIFLFSCILITPYEHEIALFQFLPVLRHVVDNTHFAMVQAAKQRI